MIWRQSLIALCQPEKIDLLLFWFYRFSQCTKLELQKATAVDTDFYYKTGSEIKATGSILEMKKFSFLFYCYIDIRNLTSDRTFNVEKDHMTSDLNSSKATGLK